MNIINIYNNPSVDIQSLMITFHTKLIEILDKNESVERTNNSFKIINNSDDIRTVNFYLCTLNENVTNYIDYNILNYQLHDMETVLCNMFIVLLNNKMINRFMCI